MTHAHAQPHTIALTYSLAHRLTHTLSLTQTYSLSHKHNLSHTHTTLTIAYTLQALIKAEAESYRVAKQVNSR